MQLSEVFSRKEIKNKRVKLDEAAQAAIWAIIRSAIAKMGTRAFAMWMLRWLFTTATGLTAMAILTVIQLVVSTVVQMITGVSTSVAGTAFEQIKKLMNDEGEDGEDIMQKMADDLESETADMEEDPNAEIEDYTPEELYAMLKRELGDEV